MQLRLDKYLADMGMGTRSEVKHAIKKNQVQINGRFPTGPEEKVSPGYDCVVFRGNMVEYVINEYYLLYKPQGCVSAVTDSLHKTVLDYIESKNRRDLFPVGRLDLDTEGLLLITNDGVLAHNLLAPGKHVEKTYYARVNGTVTDNDKDLFLRGVDIGDEEKTRPAHLQILTSGLISEIELTITEGRYHQVKRMFQAVGKEVLYLKRISMGPLHLPEALSPGEYRVLTSEELKALQTTGRVESEASIC